jgi:hypothetical protein
VEGGVTPLGGRNFLVMRQEKECWDEGKGVGSPWKVV